MPNKDKVHEHVEENDLENIMNKWIAHDGKSVPIGIAGIKVDILTASGNEFNGQILSDVWWVWDDSPFDIVAYKPHPVKKVLYDIGIADHF